MLLATLMVVSAGAGWCAAAEPKGVEDAWKALPKYEHGQDMAALLAIDRAVIQAMASAETRAACAARLAALLEAADTTLPARQYICLQLRQIGTAAEVHVLAKLLEKPETSEMARCTLEAIPGEASLAALRGALGSLQGKLLVGAINSLAARKDARSVAKFQELADHKDPQVVSAALWALGNIGGEQAIAFLNARAEKAGTPTPQSLAVPLLRCADALAAAGKTDGATAIYTGLGRMGQPSGVRRAALEGLLRGQAEPGATTILAWCADADPDRRLIAARRLASLSEKQLDQAATQLDRLPDASKGALLEALAARKGKSMLPLVMAAVRSDKPELKRAGLRCLGILGDAPSLPMLLDCLAAGGDLGETAGEALSRLPRKAVGDALLEALKGRTAIRGQIIEVLARLKYYEAIDPLIVVAGQDDPAVYEPALDGLKGIADPDDSDIPRLVKLMLRTPPGKHRDEVEKTIATVCGKLPAGADRAQPVLAALGRTGRPELPQYLPLLGRLGGPKVLAIIDSSLGNDSPEVKQAAVRALCNWPNADVADRLWELAGQSDSKQFRQWALRAYVRVASLKSDRPEAKTLAMLQKAMKMAGSTEDQQLVLSRAATVRTIEAVAWIAEYLDDPALAQPACQAIVELAHHRFLRQPNMARFTPLLEKVIRISKDADVVERAKKARLGL